MPKLDFGRTRWPAGHTVHMSTGWHRKRWSSFARCDCGWELITSFAGRARRDGAIEGHWRQVERENPGLAYVDGRGQPIT